MLGQYVPLPCVILSVSPFVTIAKHIITKTMSDDRLGTLVFFDAKEHDEIPMESPNLILEPRFSFGIGEVVHLNFGMQTDNSKVRTIDHPQFLFVKGHATSLNFTK